MLTENFCGWPRLIAFYPEGFEVGNREEQRRIVRGSTTVSEEEKAWASCWEYLDSQQHSRTKHTFGYRKRGDELSDYVTKRQGSRYQVLISGHAAKKNRLPFAPPK